MQRIVKAVADSFQISTAELKSRKRDEVTALARQVAIYLIRQRNNCTLAEIGQALGGRSPATVSYAYQKIASSIQTNARLQQRISDIEDSLSPMPDGRRFDGTMILECPRCAHRWMEHIDLPMLVEPALARIKAWQVCPNCGNEEGTLMLMGKKFREAYRELQGG